MNKFESYAGVLDRKKMGSDARFAYESYHGQRGKCNNPRNSNYKYYGAKGIKVLYGPREFIGWWLFNLRSFAGTTPTVGRIDHNQDYCFSNITMQDMADNSRESVLRNKGNARERKKGRKVACFDSSTGERLCVSPSIRSAAEHFQVSQRSVQFCVRGKYKKSKKINVEFKYLEVA